MSSRGRHEGGLAKSRRRERISIDQCRALLPPNCQLTDQELQRQVDCLYLLAEFVVSLTPNRATRESIEERAAIMQYDGGLSQVEAEREAIAGYVRGVH